MKKVELMEDAKVTNPLVTKEELNSAIIIPTASSVAYYTQGRPNLVENLKNGNR